MILKTKVFLYTSLIVFVDLALYKLNYKIENTEEFNSDHDYMSDKFVSIHANIVLKKKFWIKYLKLKITELKLRMLIILSFYKLTIFSEKENHPMDSMDWYGFYEEDETFYPEHRETSLVLIILVLNKTVIFIPYQILYV